ncbi:PLP-dependent aminotransferase family protein [Arsenicicoccus cauae]|uniref:aminotransferase-like domain-containing protein n=1 Tax=Arsenicicoccus cauae TaxID=2663847 RepID=UPI00370DAB6B
MSDWRVPALELAGMLGTWSDGAGSLATQLTAALAELIDVGALPPGAGLPPQRSLAHALGVSRGVVTTAYDTLTADHRTVARQGSGTRVTPTRGYSMGHASGRPLSFTRAPGHVIDLSSGALPASPTAVEVLSHTGSGMSHSYLATDGYFPAGIPPLRQALADRLTRDGMPTSSEEIMITSGAQQAALITLSALAGTGDLALVEEPTYRGALTILRGRGARIRGIRRLRHGIDINHLDHAAGRHPALAYVQTSIHNPTGHTTSPATRQAIAETANRHGLVIIDDHSMADLAWQPTTTAPLAQAMDPDLLITIGSLSKLFWGGLRIGWIRASRLRITTLVELRKSLDLGTSISDQLIACRLLTHTTQARTQRIDMLREALTNTTDVLTTWRPDWTWEPIDGGSGLWVNTHTDTAALAAHAASHHVRLTPGHAFSAHNGHTTMLRLPVWHPPEQLDQALQRLNSNR